MRTKQEILKGENESVFLLRCSMNFELFCERVLGYEMKWFHREWCQLLRTQNRIAISCVTGYGKTEIFGVAYCIWLAYFKPKSEALIVSKVVQGQSQTVLERIKIKVSDNELIKNLIPESGNKEFEFSKTRMVWVNGSKTYLSPYSSNVRGVHVDYEFGDEVSTYPDKANDYLIWFRDFLSRVENKRGKVVAASTPIEPGDLMVRLLKMKGWYPAIYPVLLDKDGKRAVAPYDKTKHFPIWIEKHSFEELMRIRQEQGEGIFERNYQCDPSASISKAIFELKKVVSGYDETKGFTSKPYGDGLVFIGCDFGISEHKDADKDAFVAVEKILDVVYVKEMVMPTSGVNVEDKIITIKKMYYDHKPYQVLCDSSNVGKYVVQRLIQDGIPAIEVPFGSKTRREMLSTLSVVISNGKLVIPYNNEDFEVVKLAEELTMQLSGFREEKSLKTNTMLFVSTAPHDDLVAGLALAVMGAMEQSVDIGGFSIGS
jgi:hypothetical protein